MKVRATKLGYYDMLKRYPGDVFELKDQNGLTEFEGKPRKISAEQQFSPRWMVKIDEVENREDSPKPKGRTRAQVARSEASSGDVDVI